MSTSAWLLLVNSLSGANRSARMRMWRALKASGAAALRDGAYLLPRSAGARAVFAEQAEEAIAADGTAHILTITAEDDAQQDDLVRLFDRSADYAALLGKLDVFRTAIAKLDEIEARRRLAALRREVATLESIDFFPGASRRQIESAMTEAEATYNKRFSPDEPHSAHGPVPARDKARFRGRLWATRQRPWIDRIASAWLIRRFIDPKARFRWLKKTTDCPKTAIGFDFDGAQFTHVGTRVTFEVLAASFGLDQNHAIARLGAMVHYLDVGGIPVPEAAGFAAIMTGARTQQATDDKLLRSMSAVLDALYASYQQFEGGGS